MYQENPLLQESLIVNLVLAKMFLTGMMLSGLGSVAYRDHVMREAYQKIADKYPDARMLYTFLNSTERTRFLAKDLAKALDLENYNPNDKIHQREYARFIGQRILKDASWKYYLSFIGAPIAVAYHMVKQWKIKTHDADDIIDPAVDDGIG